MPRVTDEIDVAKPPAAEPPGRVEFDSRGNSVWRWARDVIESTSVLLKRLDNKDLALEPTQRVPVMRDGAAQPGKQSSAAATEASRGVRHPAQPPDPRDRGSFDPYNSR